MNNVTVEFQITNFWAGNPWGPNQISLNYPTVAGSMCIDNYVDPGSVTSRSFTAKCTQGIAEIEVYVRDKDEEIDEPNSCVASEGNHTCVYYYVLPCNTADLCTEAPTSAPITEAPTSAPISPTTEAPTSSPISSTSPPVLCVDRPDETCQHSDTNGVDFVVPIDDRDINLTDDEADEWNDLISAGGIEMWEAGNPYKSNPELASKAYVHYNCQDKRLCILVVAEDGKTLDGNENWFKMYSSEDHGNSAVTGTIQVLGDTQWEGCFTVEPGCAVDVEIHANYGGGRTASTGKIGNGLSLDFRCDNCEAPTSAPITTEAPTSAPITAEAPTSAPISPTSAPITEAPTSSPISSTSPPVLCVDRPDATCQHSDTNGVDFVVPIDDRDINLTDDEAVEWDDLISAGGIEMWEAGNPNKELASKAYVHYNCQDKRLCILVVAEDGKTLDDGNENWFKMYSSEDHGNSAVTGTIQVLGDTQWEGCFTVEPGCAVDVEIHANYGGGRTTSTGKNSNGLSLDFRCDNCERRLDDSSFKEAFTAEDMVAGVNEPSENDEDIPYCVSEDYPCEGEGNDMVYVCHYSARKGYQTFCIPESDSDILRFYPNDYCGPCEGGYGGAWS